MTASIEERIFAAFSADVGSEAVAALIEEVQAAASDADQKADEARARAMDPALSLDAVSTARTEMNDSSFTRDRMNVAAECLTSRLREVRRAEEDERRRTLYD